MNAHVRSICTRPGRKYLVGKCQFVDLVNTDKFSVHELNAMMKEIGYTDDDVATFYHFKIPGSNLDYGLRGNDLDVFELVKESSGNLSIITRMSKVVIEEIATQEASLGPEGSPELSMSKKKVGQTSNCKKRLMLDWVDPKDSSMVSELGKGVCGVNEQQQPPTDDLDDDFINEDEFDNLFNGIDATYNEQQQPPRDDFDEGSHDDLQDDNGKDGVEVEMEDFDDNVGFMQDDVLNNEMGDYYNNTDEEGMEERVEYLKKLRAERGSNAKKIVLSTSMLDRRQIVFVKNDASRIRAICWGTIPELGGPSKVKKMMVRRKGVRPSNSNPVVGGPSKSKTWAKCEVTCPWVLHISKGKHDHSWMAKTYVDTYKCLQTRDVRAYTTTFLSQHIEETLAANPEIPIKSLQVTLEQKTNPSTTVKLDVETNGQLSNETRQFKRIYVCLRALKKGFAEGKREILGFDGAFMKGPFPGQVLTAVGMDSNNGTYPLAYAIVEAETKQSWSWFLEFLGDDLNLFANSNFTFISDRQKGKVYSDYLWKCAAACTVEEFTTYMEEFKAFDADAHKWLKQIQPKHWTKSHFTGRCHSDVLLNNMCEVFNNKLKEIKAEATKYQVQWNGADEYQVTSPYRDQCVVNMRKKTCACRSWELIDIPCKHAVSAIRNMAVNGLDVGMVENWIDLVYWLQTWKAVYSFKISPINGRKLWPKSGCPTIITAPKHHTQVGRPKKKRKKSVKEACQTAYTGTKNKLRRIGKTVTCGKCNKKDHNSRSCKGQ
ncbi:hypothetical protein OSB04_027887 [Centaurea solstitialis]|uniref:SWIM-type domain-containing protein n=1 Tax=Centaurea solstitialis TaxID=347529 RepID=A0AA38SSZ2_9ASTR|nr:hypothetical protein OSB04_027887 [Centaurea solstitialis]